MAKTFLKRVVLLVLLVGTLAPIKLFANDTAWQALRDGRAVAIMRHAIAPSGVDNSDLTRDICKDQRNLSQQGRDQAQKIGDFIRANGVSQAKVYSSDLCRCVDTATLLGFDQPILLPVINAFYPNPRSGPAQTAQLKQWLEQQLLQADATNILVSHGFNITELTGNFVSQGEFLIISLEDDQVVTLLRESADSY